MPTVTNLADLTHRNVTNSIESGRMKWESTCAGDLIAMFAVGGYDVVRVAAPGQELCDESKCDSRSREVRDQSGNTVAYILWCRSVPNFAFAMTCKNF